VTHIENSYSSYIGKLNDNFQPSLLYRGEFIARRISDVLEDGSRIWTIWEDGTYLECCRLCKTKDSLDITEVCRFPNFLVTDKAVFQVLKEKANVAWLNLCHFRSKDGGVHYDRFYDDYPTGNDVQSEFKTIASLRLYLANLLKKYMPFTSGDTLYIDGKLGAHNILQDLLYKAGLELVSPIDSGSNEDVVLPAQMCSTNIGHINLYTVQLESTVLSIFPENKDVMVYVESKDGMAEEVKEEIQVRHSNYDLLGNRWLTVQECDGSTQNCHYTKGNMPYTSVTE